MTQAIGALSQDDRDSWDPRPPQTQTQNDALKEEHVCFDLGKEESARDFDVQGVLRKRS